MFTFDGSTRLIKDPTTKTSRRLRKSRLLHRSRSLRLAERLEARLLLDGAGATSAAAYGQLPLSFEINQGQADGQVNFLAHGSGYGLFLTPSEAVLSLNSQASSAAKAPGSLGTATVAASSSPSDALAIQFLGANSGTQAVGIDKLAGVSNYLIGSDPAQWHTGVANYGQVEYKNLYAGIDLTYYGTQRQLEYDFSVAPGADPSQIAFKVSGAESLSIDDQGNLVMHTAAGDVVEQAPDIYQTVSGARQTVDGHYLLSAGGHVSFALGNYDRSQTLVIDPIIQPVHILVPYSTYLGGSGDDPVEAMAVGTAGEAYLAGETTSTDFPGAAGGYSGNDDAFVAKLNAAGTALVYATYLGGNSLDAARGIAIDTSGHAYVAGITYSTNFPTTAGAYQTSGPAGGSEAFVAKLNPDGSGLNYSTYLGDNGSNADATAIAINGVGEAYVAGAADASFPTTADAAQPSYAGNGDGFVTKFNANGSALVYSSYLGGSQYEAPESIALDTFGNTFVTGYTYSEDFPTTSGVVQSSIPTTFGNLVGFVSKLNAIGTALVYSTYLGGNGGTFGNSIAVDALGQVFIAGSTQSADFPTTAGAFQASKTTSGFNFDGFVSKLNSTGSALVYSTYLGGSGNNETEAIAIDAAGEAFVAGSTTSTDFPVTPGALQKSNHGNSDAFVAKLNTTGSKLLTSTYWGGTSSELPLAIAVDASQNVYLAGYTTSTDYPTTSWSYQTVNNGGLDGFVTKFDHAMFSTYTVDTTADDNDLASGNADGTTSLREAILRANADAWPATIDFAIPLVYANPGPGLPSFTIKPTSALPELSQSVFIDGYSQIQSRPNTQTDSDDAFLAIELDGSLAGTNVDGLTIAASNCTVRGLDINDYTDGIRIQPGVRGTAIQGNFLGTDLSGTLPKSNYAGIAVIGAANNMIGGTAPEARNVISANSFGIAIIQDGASGNQVQGNFIGTTVDGDARLQNGTGVFIGEGNVPGNTVGGTVSGSGNVISGNLDGIQLYGSGTTGTIVAGNGIGTTAAGDGAVPNFDGVLIYGGASGNVIGAAGGRNTISGNTNNGVVIRDPGTTGNIVQGNFIGTNYGDTAAIPNHLNGVRIVNGASGNVIGALNFGNFISGNLSDGVFIGDPGTTQNQIADNWIGLDITGSGPLPNQANGVSLQNGAHDNTIGGFTNVGSQQFPAGNVISGNLGSGVAMAGVSNTTVLGNKIGTDVSGTHALANGAYGALVSGGASDNTIGAPAAGNVISANAAGGVNITDPGTSDNVLERNTIGLDVNGQPLGNQGNGVTIQNGATNNRIVSSGSGNFISANTAAGVEIVGVGTTGNVVLGNFIGLDFSGTQPRPNARQGVLVDGGASSNRIGQIGNGNVISANGRSGVTLFGAGTSGNWVQANLIGTDASGATAMGNGISGVYVQNGASGNTIGTDGLNLVNAAGEGNLISGNHNDGVTLDHANGNLVAGNRIGTDATGKLPLPNADSGVYVVQSQGNRIGTNSDGRSDSFERNIISGNTNNGVTLDGLLSTGNTVAGNFIGADITGRTPLPNRTGVQLIHGASRNTIGGAMPGAGNEISGNSSDGLDVSGNGLPAGVVADYAGDGNAADALALHNGTASGDVAFVPGYFGQAFYFDGGATGEVDVPASPTLDVGAGTGFTLTAFINPEGIDQQYPIIEWTNGVHLWTNVTFAGASGPNNVYASLVDSNGTNHVISSAPGVVHPRQWQFVALTYDEPSGLATLYLNGAQVAQANLGSFHPNTSTDLTIGRRRPDSFGGYDKSFAGAIDEVGIYNRVLSAADLSSLASTNGAGNNVILGNSIGVALNPAVRVANGGNGIVLDNSSGNQLAGNDSSTGGKNVIAGNAGEGLLITGALAQSNVIDGNEIGTDVTGTVRQGNGDDGVRVSEAARFNAIGQSLGNLIANNGGAGIVVGSSANDFAYGNIAWSNRIYGNVGLGIDIGNDGVTPNLPGSPASVPNGPNNLVDMPVITSASAAGGTTVIQASMHGYPNLSYELVQFYADDAPDPTGYGQGQTFLGQVYVTTDASGNATASLNYAGNLLGKYATATFTQQSYGGTSEFAQDLEIVGLAATLSSLSPSTLAEGATSLTVNGGNFITGAVVLLNGNPLPTTWLNAGALTATLPSGLEEGNAYRVAVVNPAPGGASSDVLPLTVTDAPLSASGQPIAAVEGGMFSGVVGSFTDPGGPEPVDHYSAFVNWGDGNRSQATIVPVGGGFNIVASHSYLEEGAYTATTTIVEDGGANAAAASTVTIADGVLSGVSKTAAFTEGAPLVRSVASFEDADPKGAVGDYSAAINWGDGQSTPGTITADGAIFDVNAPHQYASDGTFTVTIVVRDAGGASATVTSTAVVADSLAATEVDLTVIGNKNFNGAVATFTDADNSKPGSSDYTATITWDDGTTSNGTFQAKGGGVNATFSVLGIHHFAAFDGFHTISVAITDLDDGSVTTVIDTVLDPPGLTPNQIYVLNAYQDAFGTAGTTTTMVAGASLGDWAAKLDAGATHASFATALLHSGEYYGLIVGRVYGSYLGRASDADGLAYWIAQLQQGMTDEKLEAAFAAAPEFYQHAGGSDAGWVSAMYVDILGRSADANGLTYWTGQLAQGANRATVAQGFASSVERETQRVSDDYFADLGRAADPAGQAYWVNAFENGLHNEDVIAGFLASDEYYAAHSS